MLPEQIPFELDLTKGAKDDNNVSLLDPISSLKKSGAHMAFLASTTKEMSVSDDLIRSFGKKKVKDDKLQNIEIALPPSAYYIPKQSIVRELDV